MEVVTDLILEENASENKTLDIAVINPEVKGPQINNSSCRLCLREQEELCPDIFAVENEIETTSLAERLYDLFQIKYENLPALPHRVCQSCIFFVEAFSEFRNKVHKCETELMKRYKELKTYALNENNPAGLNENSGVFIPNDACEIIDVDPEEDYESSDDDFSMGSESETEETQHQQETNNANDTSTNSTDMSPAMSNVNVTADFNNTSSQPPLETSYKTPCYLCQYCDMAFSNQESCTEHESTHHDQQYPYSCNFCEVRHTNRQTMIAHIRQAHQPDRPYVCTLCGKGFCRRSDLKKHTIVHTGIRPYTCPMCSKGFSRNTNLMKHIRIHTSAKPHVCQLCPRSFGTAQELVVHTRTHSEPKPNQCDQCTCSFMRKDQLNAHKLSHLRQQQQQLPPQHQSSDQYQHFQQMNANEREYTNTNLAEEETNKYLDNNQEQQQQLLLQQQQQQQQQRQQFINDSNDNQHSILAGHLMQQQTRTPASKSRIFNCDICAKTFRREKDYFRHQALHLEDIYTCKVCNICFSRREKLVRHIESEHNTHYICESCNIKFPNAEGLQIHMKMHELHQHVALNNQAALSGGITNFSHNTNHFNPPNSMSGNELLRRPDVYATLAAPIRASADEINFYSQMVPTMNLGFYSETRPDA